MDEAAAEMHVQRLAGCTPLTELCRVAPDRYPFLLQSVTHGKPEGAALARFDILFAFPGDTLELSEAGLRGPGAEPGQTEFLVALDQWWAQDAVGGSAVDDLPFRGGWFLYLGYELAGEIEPGLALQLPTDEPVAFATRIPAAIINDRLTNETVLVAESGHEHLLPLLSDDLAAASRESAVAAGAAVGAVSEDPEEAFIVAVKRAKDHIAAGDIFQANLSRCWQAPLHQTTQAVDLYQRLCATNPAPFAGLINRPGFAVASSSPERLVRRSGRRLDTRPIAGTRPRSRDPEAAAATRADLLNNPKERAEHIMLIDLERNDLGRVCRGGSVTVDEYMVVETYEHVHHIVSNITGEARRGLTPGELIRAVFPGGTITGCPKVRCMEIISELERRPRGAYTGSMGFLNKNGDCDLNILIRTLTIKEGIVNLAAGSGVVADSDPYHELSETRAKAKGLLLALDAAIENHPDRLSADG